VVYTLVDSPLISVIVPLHSMNHKLTQIRKVISTATVSTQLILVLNNPVLAKQITPKTPNESVVIAPRKGRGFAFVEGITHIKGTISMLLHSDTVPPLGWDRAILAALENPHVVGGGFSMTYGRPKPYLEPGIWMMNQWFRISGEIYGDRAMFIRSKILKRCLSMLEVPIFEDLRLVQSMHKFGQVVLLKEKVETGAKTYRDLGFLRYFGNFLLCRVWYALGGSPFQIYNFYYPSKKMKTG